MILILKNESIPKTTKISGLSHEEREREKAEEAVKPLPELMDFQVVIKRRRICTSYGLQLLLQRILTKRTVLGAPIRKSLDCLTNFFKNYYIS